MNKKTALITGATGMAGSQALSALLENPEIEKVISIGRRKSGIQNGKLIEFVHQNFNDFTGLKEQLTGIDVCVYCLSVYQNMVDKQQYEEITCAYQKALTDVLEETSPNVTFVLFGAAGADSSEKSRLLFARVKGKAENLLLQSKFEEKYILRPGFIYPTGKRKPPGFLNKMVLPLMKVMFKLFPNTGVYDYNLGKALVKVALNGYSKSILENSDIRKLTQ